MGKLLLTLLTWLLSTAFKRVLIGAGLGLATSTFINSLLTSYITNATNNLDIGNSLILSFLHISGADISLSIIVGALVTRAAIQATSISLTKLS